MGDPGGPSTAATPAAAEVPPSQRTLTGAERDQLMAEVRLTFDYQRTFWDAIRTGVALGAEEVQDQRLAAAETPPEANLNVVDVFVFFVVWTVEAPLAARILGAVRGMVVRSLERQMRLQASAYRQLIATEIAQARSALDEARRIAARRVGRERIYRSALGEQAFQRNQQARAAAEDAAAALQELQRVEQRVEQQFPGPQALSARASLRRTALALRGIRQPDLPEHIAGLANVSLQRISPDRPQLSLVPGVSQGVNLRARVETQALELIQESHFQEELYGLIIRNEGLTAARAAEVFEDIGTQAPINVGAVLDQYRLMAAALIWSQLLDASGLRARRRVEQDAARRPAQRFAGDPRPPYGRPFTALEQHRNYLIARFGDPAEAWARGAPQDVLLPGPYPQAFGPPTPQAVEAYLDAGRSNASPGILQRFSEALGSPEAGPSVLRLDLVLQWLSALGEQAPETVVQVPQRVPR
jgi:hypothetical protein